MASGAVGAGVEHHLEPGGGAVPGDVGVTQRLEPLVAVEIELRQKDGVRTAGEGLLK